MKQTTGIVTSGKELLTSTVEFAAQKVAGMNIPLCKAYAVVVLGWADFTRLSKPHSCLQSAEWTLYHHQIRTRSRYPSMRETPANTIQGPKYERWCAAQTSTSRVEYQENLQVPGTYGPKCACSPACKYIPHACLSHSRQCTPRHSN